MKVTISEVIRHLEAVAPVYYQEDYDNSGLLTGSQNNEVTGVLISLDCIESVVDEAIEKNCNLIIAHHPIIFKGLKKITGSNYIERTIIKAIKNDIAIYSIHTNLDNVLWGVNDKIADKIGLINRSVLAPKSNTLLKLESYVPHGQKQAVLEELYAAGAGGIGKYKECSFQTKGVGTFTPDQSANPFIGKPGTPEAVNETKIEVILPAYLRRNVLAALRKSHPYEEISFHLMEIINENQEIGAGLIGELATPMEPNAFLNHLKDSMQLNCIRHTEVSEKKINRVALCGGSGSFLLNKAKSANADIYITADMKYHEFFDADKSLIIADIGHYESEVYTKELIYDILTKKFSNFAVNLSEIVTNPISYL